MSAARNNNSRAHGFYSHWCVLLQYHLRRRRLNVSTFATLVNRSQQLVHTYITGKARPPLDNVTEWAIALGMTPQERDQFVLAAYEVHTPEVIWRRLLELEHRSEGQALLEAGEAVRTEVVECRRTVSELVATLADLEALFFTREVPPSKFAAERRRLGALVRAAVEKYSKPPSPSE